VYSLEIEMTSNPSQTKDRSEYFYEMLDQLLVIGRQAGGDALVDATLIGGLLASRKANVAAETPDERRSA
jgi:hypothetical protein